MSSLLPITINGVQFKAQGEYTSAQVATEYQNSLAAFVNVFNVGLDPDISGVNPTSTTLSSDIIAKLQDPGYASQMLNALVGGNVSLNYGVDPSLDPTRPVSVVQVSGLLNVLANGLNVPGGNPPQQYMSVEMTSALQQLIATLKMAGVNIQQSGSGLVVIGGITPAMVENWKNLADSSNIIGQIMQAANNAAGSSNRTLQALVELIYVKTGNELLSNSLDSLQSALQNTSSALSTLNSLQSLHNMVTAVTPPSFTSAAASTYGLTTVSDFVKGTAGIPGINKAADTYFAGLDPTVLGTITINTLNQFMSARTSLMQEIQQLSGQTAGNQQGTLVGNLRTVLADINKAFASVGIPSTVTATTMNTTKVQSAFTKWLIDSNAIVHTALNILDLGSGAIQRNITAAISAGQSLNATQQQTVQRYMFVFEEYYKSASAILNTISQIIQKMAGAIAR